MQSQSNENNPQLKRTPLYVYIKVIFTCIALKCIIVFI